jgi:IclR family transcriptional regulator, acetate operon repressor
MINSVRKAIQVMHLFSASEPRLTLTEISRRLNMPKSTAHSLLNTLVPEGFIEKVGRDSYALGTAVIVMTQNVRVNVEMRDRAAPYLRELADQCDESVYLTVRNGDYVLYIYAIESSRRLIARTAVGDRAYMHSTGVGKAILAELPAEQCEQIISRVGLPAVTKHSITDFAQLQRVLEQTRERGYSIDNQENELRNYCLGTALYDGSGQVIGACSVAGTDPEIIGVRMPELSDHLLRTGLTISRNLGYVPASMSKLNHMPL